MRKLVSLVESMGSLLVVRVGEQLWKEMGDCEYLIDLDWCPGIGRGWQYSRVRLDCCVP
jgi:hypothetical protein